MSEVIVDSSDLFNGISLDGRMPRVQLVATGKYAQTPTGDCIEIRKQDSPGYYDIWRSGGYFSDSRPEVTLVLLRGRLGLNAEISYGLTYHPTIDNRVFDLVHNCFNRYKPEVETKTIDKGIRNLYPYSFFNDSGFHFGYGDGIDFFKVSSDGELQFTHPIDFNTRVPEDLELKNLLKNGFRFNLADPFIIYEKIV